ncbi:hypothetical protein FisN_2Lh003 [Fistulifera solaris]|uniref:Uncharacterized protein n=1 Tax=Fistulifera solaris TaxID=1519565 RepID=A0A1Z5JWZ8_FISSO|nr:hypothetical protein FisN_2Lh003 [Fistulifera solaris]|eukprot:GAX18396.1 hypothetical protein FisN_2Lh003 [Fistulifera solaris]
MFRLSVGVLWLFIASSCMQNVIGQGPNKFLFHVSDLTEVFDELTTITGPLSSQDILNAEIPFVDKSINEMIGGDAAKTIATLLDFSDFVQFTIDENNGVDIELDRGEIAAELTSYLQSLDLTSDLLAGEGCTKNIDATYVEGGEETVQLTFCVLFNLTRSTTLSGDGLFDSIPEIFEIDLDVSLDFAATLLFKAQLDIAFIPNGATANITVDPVIAAITANGDVDVTVGVGVLELLSTATAIVDATFELANCDNATETCDNIGTRLGDSDFYLERAASYSIAGNMTLGSTFPGLTLGGDASFSVVEEDIFNPAPNVTFESFNFEDFISFSPENSVAMLRLIDSAIVRAQENEAFNTNIPLTDTSVAEILSTGSLVTTSLLRLFQKVEPYEDRPTKSLFLKQSESFPTSTTDTTDGKTYEIYVLVGDSTTGTELNVNPDNQAALYDLVESEGVICSIEFDENFSDSTTFKDGLLTVLQAANCPGLTVCEAETDCDFDEESGDFSGCTDGADDCLLAVGIDEDDLVFIVSNADSDVHLIGFMEPLATTQGEGTIYKFPVNTPAFPALIPRFRSWQNFTDFLSDAIASSTDIVDVSVDFSYTEAIAPDPAQYELVIGFSKSASFSVGLNASEGIGDLIDITVSEGSSLDLTVSAAFETTFGVLMEADDDQSLTVLAESCGGDGFACVADSLDIVLFYVENVDGVSEDQWINTTVASSTNKNITQELEDAIGEVATVTEQGSSLLVIRFNPNITDVKLLLLKNCNSTDITTEMKQSSVLECQEDELVSPIANDYGLEDFSLSKRKWQIAIGDASISANVTVSLNVQLSTNVGGVIEVTAELEGDITGYLELSLGTGELLPFSDWLVALINIFDSESEGYIADFFEASATFDATFEASVEPSSPFNLLATASASGGFAEPFVIDFLAKNFSYPEIEFDVNIEGIGDVRKLTFRQVVAILADVLEFLVGSNEDDGVDSCSGGLLGQDAFTYQLPVIGISVCSTASFLQVLVNAVEELLDETTTSGSKTTTTFSSLEVKLETLLQDGVGGTPSVNITTTSDSIRSELSVELTLAWTFTLTETFVLDMSNYFSEEDLENNAGLDFFANALLPGTGEGQFGLEAGLVFTMGVGLEYVSATNDVNPFVKGTTGFKLQLAAAGSLDYECSVGAFQGGVEAEFSFGDGDGGPMELSVGLDESLNYYLSDPGADSSNREGFKIVSGISGLVSEVEAVFAGQATANLTAGLSLLGLSIDVDAAISDLQAFFLGNTSVLSVEFTPSFPSFEVPSLLDILLAEPQGIIDALDDVFKTAEEASVGENGIITRFPVPFIRNGLGDALGAGTSNNILAKGRNKVIPFLQEGLDSFEGKTDTVGDVLARLMDKALDAVEPSLRLEGRSTEFICYIYSNDTLQQEAVDCVDETNDPTSVMWSLPFGQSFSIDLPLDFDLDAGSFPLEITFDGGDSSLKIGWGLDLAFGYMEGPGFFLFTFPDDGPEITIEAGLSIVGFTLDATLLFLKGSLSNGNLVVAVGLSVDMDKGNALRLKSGENATDPQYGRLTRDSFRKITKISDLFVPGATAGATVEIPDVRFQVSVELLGGSSLAQEVVAYIPQLTAEIYAQARKVLSTDDSPARRLKFEAARRSLGVHPALAGHDAAPLSRSLSFSDEFALLADDFVFEECPIEADSTFCARVSQLNLDMSKIRDLVEPVLVEITNKDETGFLDKMVRPLIILEERLPGISDIMNKKITVLDIAEAMIGPKSGAPTVRRIIQTYRQINDLIGSFLEDGGLLLAEECDVLDSFTCTGGVFNNARRGLTIRVSSSMSQLFDLEDASLLPTTPSHVIELERGLQSGTCTINTSDCSGSCSGCTGTTKIKCQKDYLVCKAKSVKGLTFPFMSDLTSVVGLLSGGDIQIVDFTPDPVTFAFTFELFFVLYTPPTVELAITFEFTAVLRVGFVLDSKGIREAVEQEEPIKALNSFALKDTFDGVDEAMITLTASVTISVDVSAVIIKVGVSGAITFIVTVDLYDPYPEKSGGLVRPFELLTSGSNPLEWFEFGIQIFITITLYVKIGLFLGFVEITLFKYEVSFKFDLIPPLLFVPAIDGMPVSVTSSGSLQISASGAEDLACTGLEGTTGNERIECFEGLGVQDFTGIKSITDSSAIASIASETDVVYRNMRSPVNTPATMYSAVTFDYVSGTDILSNDEIVIFQNKVFIGTFNMAFRSIGRANIKLPTPEQSFLTTTINDCNTQWELNGHTNIEINATAFQSGCDIIAPGGEATDAKLTIDFGFEDNVACEDGNIVKLSMSGNDLVAEITRATSTGSVTKQFTFGSPFIYVEIKMSNCADTVIVESSTTNEKGYISVEMGDDDDEITIGTDSAGLADISVRVLIDGNDGSDTLTINDKGETSGRNGGQLSSASVLGLMFGEGGNNTDVDFSSIEIVNLYLSKGSNEFFVDSTPQYSETFMYFQSANDILTVNATQGNLFVEGGGGNDVFYVYGAGDDSTITIFGEDGDDTLLVDGTDGNVDMTVNTLDTSSVRWSGGLNNDEITVVLTSTGSTNIDLFDDSGLGINKLAVECSNFACYLLSRRTFIANIHDVSDVSSDVERISIDINSVNLNTIQVNLNNGENEMYFDDTMAPMNVFGGNDADSFYIGQLYNSERDEAANVNINDPISTTLTTKGYLSDGNSFSLTLNGGFGNDYFDVLRNRFLLDLNGDSDDDLFVVRSFLALDLDSLGNPLENTTLGNITLLGADGSDTFDLSGTSDNSTESQESSDSSQLPNYVVNSLVDVDGGTGNDKLIVVGTEADDRYVITADSVFGGGLSISFTNIEAIALTGGAGDDTLTVLSTSPNLALYLYGAEGSDTFVITPQKVDPVVSKNLRGHRGILRHTVTSADLGYDGLAVEGVAVDVLDNDGDSGAYFNVIETEVVHVMDEDGLGTFSFWLYPTVTPDPWVTVQVASQTDVNGNAWLLLNGDDLTAVELVFNETAEPQEVIASFNPAAARLEITDYNLLIKLDLVPLESPDLRFETTAQTIRPVSVKLLPAKNSPLAKSVTVVQPDGDINVGEGDQGWSSSYDVYLRPCTNAMIQNTIVEIVPTETGRVTVNPEVIDSAHWGSQAGGCKVTVQVTPAVDSDEEGIHFVTLTHKVVDSNQEDIRLSDDSILYAESVLVRIYDDLVPNVVIKESLSVTSTAELDQDVINLLPDESFYVDSYTIRLASEPEEDVIVTVESIAKASDYDLSKNTEERVQVLVGAEGSEAESLQLTFTKTTWFIEQTVRVVANNDNVQEGVDLLHFPDQPSFLAYIQGPIFIEGDTSPDVPDIRDAVLFPGENDTSLFAFLETPPSELVYPEMQVDTLKIFNIDVQGSSPSIGTLTDSQFVGYNMAKEIIIGGESKNDGISYSGMEVIEFYFGSGVDSITVESTSVAVHFVDLGDGNDSVKIQNISGHFIIHGSDGSDTVTVASVESTVDAIKGLLAFDGGNDDAAIDHLIIDNSGDITSDDILNVTRNTVEIESMSNTEDEESRIPRDVFIFSLRGSTSGYFNLAVNDPITNMTTDTDIPYPTNSELIEEALQDLIFPAAKGDVCGKNQTSRCAETVKVYAVGDEAFAVFFLGERLNDGLTLTLTTSGLADFTPEIFVNASNDILLRSTDVAYADVEVLDITMGNPQSSDFKIVVNVRGTTAITTITTQDGDDAFFVSSEANENVMTSSTVDFLHGWLDYIENDLFLNAASGRHRLLISDESSYFGKGPAILSSTSFTAIHEDVGDIFFTADGGNWISGVNLWLSPNNDEVSVVSIASDPTSPSFQTTTSVHCGDGNDKLTISIDEVNTVFVANGQGGNDILDASESSVPVILFGDGGRDTLTGGTSNDIIIGDFGRVLWRSSSSDIFQADNAIAARAGGGGYGDFTDGVLRFVTDAFSLAFDEGDSDIIILGEGDDCAIGGFSDDQIFGNLGNDIIFGDSAQLLFDMDSGFPTSLLTLSCDQGGNDILSGGEGVVNYIVGGSFDDTIQGSGAMDLVFGDHASISLYADSSHKLQIAVTVDPACGGGSDEIYLGAGDDIAFGGAHGDYIEGNAGQDVILGDFGVFDTETEFLDHQNYQSFIEFPESAGDDVIHGGDGDDFLLGQEGSDKVYGEAGNDDIYGGHNIDFGDDTGDELSGGLDEDSILGDNGQIVRQLITSASEFPWLNGMVWLKYTEPFDTEVVREIRRYDDVDEIGGDDNIEGGDGNDTLHGQRGDDVIDGGNGQDEIYGELGADTLLGGNGSDIVLGDVGYIVRRYEKDGSARLNTDGTWHKDVILEEVGYISGVDRISQKLNVKTSSLSFESVVSASLLFVAPAYTNSGGKYAAGGDDWLTDLIQFELVDSYDDVIDGGDGNDILIGQRGGDRINGGPGNDVIIGDAGWNVVPVHMDLPQIHQVYRALRDQSSSNYLVEGVSDKEYGILFAAEYELYPDQYGQIDFLGSIVDMVLNADHVLSGHNLLRDVLGVAGISTTNGKYCVHPMFRITPGFLRDNQKIHGNDVITSGLGDNLVIGDDIRAYSGIDVSDVPEIVSIQRRIDNLVKALGVRLSTMEVDQESFSGGMIGSYNISVGDDEIETSSGGFSLVTGDTMTLVVRTVGSGSFVNGQRLLLDTDKLKSMMQRLADVERILWDVNICLYELHTDLMTQMTATYSDQIGQKSTHALSLANDIITSNGNGDILIGDSSLLYFHVDKSPSAYRLSYLSRSQRRFATRKLRNVPDQLRSSLISHVSRLSRSAAFNGQAPFDDLPFVLTVGSDTLQQNLAVNLAAGDFAFFGSVVTFQNPNTGSLSRYTQSIKNVRSKLASEDPVASLQFGIQFYDERYSQLPDASKPKLHGDSFTGLDNSNVMLGEFLTGEMYNEIDSAQTTRVALNANAFSSSAAQDFAGDFFNIQVGTAANGQFGPDFSVDGIAIDAQVAAPIETSMKGLFLEHRLIQDLQEILFTESGQLRADRVGTVTTGPHCSDAESSSTIAPAA